MAVHKESYSNFIQIESYVLFQGNAKILVSLKMFAMDFLMLK